MRSVARQFKETKMVLVLNHEVQRLFLGSLRFELMKAAIFSSESKFAGGLIRRLPQEPCCVTFSSSAPPTSKTHSAQVHLFFSYATLLYVEMFL